MRKRRRLIWRLYPPFLIIILFSLIAVTWYASNSLRRFYLDQRASDLEARARLFEKQISVHLSPLDQQSIDLICKSVGEPASARISVILASGKVIGDSHGDPAHIGNHGERPEVREALRGRVGIAIRYSQTLDEKMMYIAFPVKKDGRAYAVIRTSIPVSAIDVALNNIQEKIAVGGLIIAVLAAIVCLLVSRRITRPIEHIKKWSQSIAKGDFSSRLPAADSEEISTLSETMNQMASELRDRIETVIRQRNEIEAVFSSMVEGVIAVDMEERVISMNEAAAQTFKSNPSDAQGRSIKEVVRNTALNNFVSEVLESQEPVERDIVIESEGERYLNGHGTLLSDGDRNKIGAVIVLSDVTRLHNLENLRREFVANVSHEMRTPITAIKGFVETLRGGEVTPKDAERFLNIISEHVTRLEAIVEDLLSLSRIEREGEKHKIELSEGSIAPVLQAAIEICEVNVAAKGIRIELTCDEGIVARINPALLEQAVVNLLDNAIKYSAEQSVVKVDAAQTESEITISVRDYGRGIEKEHLSRLFERFYRVDKARSRSLGGTGLGLAIVKHITLAHGGHVTVESLPCGGSTFILHLPKVLKGA